MQRKTNLFYSKGQDSNFLTFSNFTEALTGNFLSTDWKVYPSRFLCLYIPSLDPENENYIAEKKNEFIVDNLVRYYENKLAFLRDYYAKQLNTTEVETEYDIEGDVNALAWLMKTIYKFDENTEINFIGEVTEFDYKGTYTDSICIIDASEGYEDNTNVLKTYKITVNSDRIIPYKEGEDDIPIDILYNWTSNELADTDYAEKSVIFEDNENTPEYEIYSEYDLITEQTDRNSIRFNVLIPLFDITNIYAETNDTSIENSFSKEENLEYKNYIKNQETDEWEKQTIDYESKELRSVNNPMGIWFADEVIELKRDKENKYAPSWSLTISSQFKPFPYSNNYLNNDITSTDNKQAFATYAQILANQTNFSDVITNLSSRVTKLEQIVANLNKLDNTQLINNLSEWNVTYKNIENIINNFDSIINTKVAEAVANNANKWKS